jgi:hypothetical protein
MHDYDELRKSSSLSCSYVNRPTQLTMPQDSRARSGTTIYFLICMGWGWSPFGSTRHCCHQLPIVPAPGDYDDGEFWWNDWQGKPKYSDETCSNAALSTTHSTCCPDANPGRCGGKPATNRLSYGTALGPIGSWVSVLLGTWHLSSFSCVVSNVWRFSDGPIPVQEIMRLARTNVCKSFTSEVLTIRLEL